MVTKRTAVGKKVVSKLKLRKETVRSLDVKNSSGIKGGAASGAICVKLQKKTI